MILLSRTALGFVLAVALAGCVTSQGGKNRDALSLYNCGDTPLSAKAKNDETLVVNVNGKVYELAQTETASGTKYKKLTPPPQVTFWSKGDEATLEVDGKALPTCSRVKSSLYIDTSNYRAIGNDPSWYASISDNEIRLTTKDEDKTLVSPLPAPQMTLHGQYYSIKADPHVMSMTIKNKACEDSVSGRFYPHEISIIFDGEVYKGCGTNLPTEQPAPQPTQKTKAATDKAAAPVVPPQQPVAASEPAPKTEGLYNKTWTAKEIDGKPALNAGRANLTFSEDGKLSGNAGCNALSGTYKVSGKSFTVDRNLASTLMACEASVMAQEKTLTDILLAATLIEVRNGTLIISAPNRRTITFTSGPTVWK